VISAAQEDAVRASEGLFGLAFVTVTPGLVLVVASPFMLIGLYRPPRLRAACINDFPSRWGAVTHGVSATAID
jgi:hypothetical protein